MTCGRHLLELDNHHEQLEILSISTLCLSSNQLAACRIRRGTPPYHPINELVVEYDPAC